VAVSPSYAADAKTLYNDAQELYKKGDFEEALVKFRQALDISGSPNARLAVGRCLKDLNRKAEAYEELQRAMREANEKVAVDEAYIKTRDSAASIIGLLEPQIGKVLVLVTNPPEDVVVKLDGAPMPKDRLGVPYAVEPRADILVVASSKSQPSVEKHVEVKPGQIVTVQVEFKSTGGAAPPAPGPGPGVPPAPTTSGTTEPGQPPPPSVPEEPSQFTGMRVGGILIATVLGVGGGVAFAVTGSMANTAKKDLEAAGCPYCDATSTNTDNMDKGRTMQTIANISLGVGIAGLVGGTLMIILGGPDEEAAAGEAPPAAAPAVAVTPEGGYVGYTWRF
jgi:hypothetical protein